MGLFSPREIEFRKDDLRAAARDTEDTTLTRTERAAATAAMLDHAAALAEAGVIRSR